MRTHRFWLMVHARDTKMNRKPIISFGDETCGRTWLPVLPFYVLKGNNELTLTLENVSALFLKSLSFLLAYHTTMRRQIWHILLRELISTSAEELWGVPVYHVHQDSITINSFEVLLCSSCWIIVMSLEKLSWNSANITYKLNSIITVITAFTTISPSVVVGSIDRSHLVESLPKAFSRA